jgi:hypothetical protein
MRKSVLLAAILAFGGAAALAPAEAEAFCGFYVSGADAKLFNNATQVVLMRDGVRTVLSMQNNYQGPPENFAMVVPVPVVLQKENVKTLPSEIFARVDSLSAPRLVEYWEQDPCQPRYPPEPTSIVLRATAESVEEDSSEPRHYGVKIEAKFSVGEYDILILSAADSTGLDTFLRKNGYKIPAGAEPYLRPYVMSGSKFFVAKVDVKKVRFQDGQAMLSPIRFHYDAETFSLPVRLGLINSAGAQDLIVNILARARYEVANYDNFAIPTNIDVTGAAKEQFGAFYAALFDKMLAQHPRAVITEYAWSAGSCDPCPEPPLEPSEIATLGADALPAVQANVTGGEVPPEFATYFTLTRLHVRYGKDSLGEDLVFRAAPGIVGGQGVPGPNGELDRGVRVSSSSAFQGRYVLRHPWAGAITCADPQRGIWGGPVQAVAGGPMSVATNTAFAPRGGVALTSMIAGAVPELEGQGEKLPSGSAGEQSWPDMPKVSGGGCAACSLVGDADSAMLGALSFGGIMTGAALLAARRRRRKSGPE